MPKEIECPSTIYATERVGSNSINCLDFENMDDDVKYIKYSDHLQAVQDEREACAKIIENSKAHNFTLQQLANKIRARE